MPVVNLLSKLELFKGKHIRVICDSDFFADSNNHCAHFVSHVMGYSFGFKCSNMTGKGSGANIRVHEIFKKCPAVGEWADRPSGECLAFVTASSHVNLKSKIMVNVPAKHIGIFCNNQIYHYSNSQHKVISETPEKFSKHYPGSTIKVYFGTFPIS